MQPLCITQISYFCLKLSITIYLQWNIKHTCSDWTCIMFYISFANQCNIKSDTIWLHKLFINSNHSDIEVQYLTIHNVIDLITKQRPATFFGDASHGFKFVNLKAIHIELLSTTIKVIANKRIEMIIKLNRSHACNDNAIGHLALCASLCL